MIQDKLDAIKCDLEYCQEKLNTALFEFELVNYDRVRIIKLLTGIREKLEILNKQFIYDEIVEIKEALRPLNGLTFTLAEKKDDRANSI